MGIEVPITLGILDGVVVAMVAALTALGLSLVFGIMRIVNVSHGEFYMLGAIIAWFVVTYLGSFLLALVLAPLAVGGLATAVERTILKKIRYDPESTIVATIGLLYAIQQVVLATFGPYAREVSPPFYFRVDLGFFGYSGYKVGVAVISAILIAAVYLLIYKTRLGLFMRATQQDTEIAQAFGVPVRKVYTVSFALGAALAAAAGVLIVPIQQAYYLMGLDALLLSFIIVIVGGLGSIKGTLVAALIVGLLDGVVSVFFSPTLSRILSSLLVAGVILVRPRGLFGSGKTM
ncbi:High-affinity branched-chain amino acid transport system permease protein LivH [archaeon HR01]|nr:High-affinity branched-chain amino acid transport system permease protein LivH [archaeon HR01]